MGGGPSFAREQVNRQCYIAFLRKTTGNIANVVRQPAILMTDQHSGVYSFCHRTRKIARDLILSTGESNIARS